MPNRCCTPRIVVCLAGSLLVQQRAAAQGSIADRLRKIADDEKKAVVADANRQVNSAITDAVAAKVADGSFSAAFSPWASSDGTKRVEIARYQGSAFAVTTPTGRQIVLCDDKGVLAWSASFAILDKAPAGAPGAGRGGAGAPAALGAGRGRGASSPPPAPPSASGRGASSPPPAPPPASGRGGAASPGGRGGGSGSATGGGTGKGGRATGAAGGTTADSSAGGRGGTSSSTAAAPTADQREFRFPSPQVTVTLPTSGPRTGVPGSGSIRVGDLSQDIFVGAAKIRYNQVTIPGEKTPQIVDFGVAFKARVLPAGDQPAGCAVGGGAKSAVATNKAAAPNNRPAVDTSSAATPGRPSAGASVSAGASFTEGDVLTPRIANINLLAAAQDSAKVAAVIKKGDELVYLGQEQSGYVHVSAGTSEGWVRKVLVIKR